MPPTKIDVSSRRNRYHSAEVDARARARDTSLTPFFVSICFIIILLLLLLLFLLGVRYF